MDSSLTGLSVLCFDAVANRINTLAEDAGCVSALTPDRSEPV